MPDRPRIAASLWWLAALVALAMVAALAGGGMVYWQTRHQAQVTAEAITGGSVRAGGAAIRRYGCGGCHVISGIAGANGMVGPNLSQISTRAEIAGRLPNQPDALRRWLMHPQAISPGSGMPEQGVTDRAARDIAAYLYARN